MDPDPFLRQRRRQRVGQLVLELLAAFAHDEVLGAVGRAFQARHGQDLRHDDLFHRRGQIAVGPEDPRHVLRQQLELHRHVEADLESVARREFHELLEHERDRRRAGAGQLPRQFFAVPSFGLGFLFGAADVGHLERRDGGRGREASAQAHAGAGFGAHVALALGLLFLEHVLLQGIHRHVLRGQQGLGDDRAAALADQGDLVHADFQHVDLVFARIDEIQAGLEHVAAHALFARLREGVRRGLLAGQRRHHAVVADRNAERVHDVDLVARRIHAVFSGPEHMPPDALLAGLGQEFAFGQVLADLGRDDAHLARRNDHHGADFAFVEPRIQEMPALAEHVFLDAPLAFLRQDLARRQFIPCLGGDDGHLVRLHVEPAEAPLPDEPRQAQHDHDQYGDFQGIFHWAPPFREAGAIHLSNPPMPSAWSPLRIAWICGAILP